MSLDARLRQGLVNTADEHEAFVDIETERALSSVMAMVERRQKVQFIALAAAAAAVALALVLGPNIGKLLLSLEPNLPPTEEDRGKVDDDRQLEDDLDRRFDRGDQQLFVPDGKKASHQELNPQPAIVAAATEERQEEESDRVPTDSSKDPRKEQDTPPVETPQTKSYSLGGAPINGGTTGCDGGGVDAAGCVTFQSGSSDRWVTIEIDDQTGQPVSAWVQVDQDGDGGPDGDWTEICNATTKPIKIQPSAIVRVELKPGDCNGTDSNPTTGSVTAVFSTG